MKQLIISFFLLYFSLIGLSQNLSFQEFNSLKNKSLAEVEEVMLKKDWEFHGAEKPTENDRGVISFINDTGDTNTSFFSLFYHPDYPRNIARLSFYSKETYKDFLSQIKAKNKLVDSKVSDKGIIKYYANFNIQYEVEITNPDPRTGKSLYTIVVSDL